MMRRTAIRTESRSRSHTLRACGGADPARLRPARASPLPAAPAPPPTGDGREEGEGRPARQRRRQVPEMRAAVRGPVRSRRQDALDLSKDEVEVGLVVLTVLRLLPAATIVLPASSKLPAK